MRVVSFKLSEDLYEILQEYSRRKKLSKSELIRRALREYIGSLEPRPYITRRLRVY